MNPCRKLDELNFYKGERRYVGFEVISTKNEKVIVSDPKFVLKYNNEIVEQGDCELVNDNEIQVLISASEVGSFDLEVTYTLCAEVRKVRCEINVN